MFTRSYQLFALILTFIGTVSIPSLAETKEDGSPIAQYAGLFAPAFTYEEIKTSENDANGQCILIKAKQRVTGKLLRQYNNLLLSRGINVYGAAYYGPFSWDRTAPDGSVTLTRKSTTEPDTLEVTESVVISPSKKQSVIPMSVDGEEISFTLCGKFGKDWRKIKLIPAAEPQGPTLKVERFPGAVLRQVREKIDGGSENHLFFVAKSGLEDITRFYEQKLRERYRTVLTPLDLIYPVDNGSYPTEVFGIKTSARYVTLSGYSYSATDKKLNFTQIILKKGLDPALSDYVEIEIREN